MLKPTGEVHPAAALFPMMTADELEDLAADIKANGLLQPIVLDHDGRLIDGRNRLHACQIAHVRPTFIELNGQDPTAYIIAANVIRRHLTTGQRAMIIAKANFSKLEKFGEQGHLARVAGVTQNRLSQAMTILDWADEEVDSVISGAKTFDVTYRLAQSRQQTHEAERERAAQERRDLEMLQREAADLAELVIEERMPLDEAMAAYRQRYRDRLAAEQEITETRRRLTANFATGYQMLDGTMLSDPGRISRDWAPEARPQMAQVAPADLYTADGLRRVSDNLRILADIVELERGGVLG